ncbi:hypothetical protein A2988_00505 [Candidatus Azambacteria bacterium RIFCSPLOWO2_01_FULL_46_25]|uniref:GtrA/DPMS transmembrane domain-containing protein n=1 Tax=Candidatus Azambacteria bacterium RIFCSPLOWO2_01_FULL_46_25 TaxID=1797298 RepID=A0A1F5BTL8_9BACT|nr:MAG: hypothetical protein A2988_00505 [Candidatus Azambacteria bacterium RIFCSPLOWO2_01_FULL_46_25]
MSTRFTRTDLMASTLLGFLIGVLAPFILSNIGKHYAFQNYLFIVFAVLAPLGLYAFALASRWMPALYQLGKFGIVGSANFFIDLGILHFIIYLSGSQTARVLFSVAFASITTWTLFKAVSFVAASTSSFFWNKFWTFQEKKIEEAKKEYVSFLTISVVGLLINSAIFSLVFSFKPESMRETLWATIAAVAGAFGGLFWNFLGYKFIVFKK